MPLVRYSRALSTLICVYVWGWICPVSIYSSVEGNMANEGSTQVVVTKESDQKRTNSADEERKEEKQFLSPQKVPGCRYGSIKGWV